MNITVLEESNLQLWNESLKMCFAGPFMTSSWVEAFRASSRTPIYFRFIDKSNTIGVAAALVLGPSRYILRKFDKTLFLFCGPALICYDEHIIIKCIISLINYAAHNGYTGVRFKSWDYPYEYDLGDFPFFKEVRSEYIIDLRGKLSAIQNKIKKKTKERVRKAIRTGLTFHESSSPAIIDDLLCFLNETKSIRLSKGHDEYDYFYIPYFNYNIIRKLLQNNIARMFYVKKDDMTLCIQLRAYYKKRVFALLAATSEEGYKLGANHFALYHQIEQFKQEGVESFNLGGVPNDSGKLGLSTYKTSFGAEKHVCVGGNSPFLQGALLNLINHVYYKKLSPKTIRKALTARIKKYFST